MTNCKKNSGPLPWQRIERVAVLRALYLGDMLCAVPALKALRLVAPQAEITLFGLPWAEEFCRHVPRLIDRFVAFPGYPGLPEQPLDPSRIVEFFRWAQGEQFNLAIQLHGSGSHANDAVQLLGATYAAGFFPSESECPDSAMFLPWPAQGSEVERNLALMEFLGAPSAGTEMEFELLQADYDRLEAHLAAQRCPAHGYIGIHAGAKWQSRRWSVEKFAAVANSLAADGHSIVLTGGASERPLVAELSRRLHRPHANLSGLTDLGALAAASQRARLVITNDTGVSHVAAALRTPSVVVVLGSDPERWAPLDRRLHEVVCGSLDCRPCPRHVCPVERGCAESVTVEEVLAAARRVIDRTQSRAGHAKPPQQSGCEQSHHPLVGGSVCVA